MRVRTNVTSFSGFCGVHDMDEGPGRGGSAVATATECVMVEVEEYLRLFDYEPRVVQMNTVVTKLQGGVDVTVTLVVEESFPDDPLPEEEEMPEQDPMPEEKL